MYKYVFTRENGQLFLECLTGNIGTYGRRLVGVTSMNPLELYDRLVDRDHVAGDPERLIYGDKEVQIELRTFRKWMSNSEDFNPNLLTVQFKCNRDPLTLVGFCKVMLDRAPNQLGRKSRVA